jgi:hypothetical protein
LAKKGAESREKLYELIEGPFEPQVTVHESFFDGLLLLGYDEQQLSPHRLGLVLYWKALREIAGEVAIDFTCVDAAGKTIFAVRSPLGRGMFPPRDWPLGAVVAEHLNVAVPERALRGDGVLKMGLSREGRRARLIVDLTSGLKKQGSPNV